MLLRTITTLVAIPAIVAIVWLGAPWLTILVLIIVVLGIRELYRLLPPGTGPLPAFLGGLWAIALVLGAQAASNLDSFLLISAGILAVGVFVGLLWMVAYYSGGRCPTAALYLMGGPVYVGFLLAHSLALRDIGETGDVGREWLLFTILVIFATDTGAFITGSILGRHHMAPSVSPNKTWEGAAGGLACSLVVAMVLGLVFDLTVPRWQQVVIGATVGVLAQWGDLLESKLKRLSNVKDTGSIIPGHGGVLDRLDSVLVSVPAVYYLLATVFEP